MHTNSTTNYSLPQFLPTDKPAWLTDVNPAYLAIDNAMKANADAAGAAQTDATQALADAAGATATATQADAKASGAVASLSEQFLDTNTYSVGEYVIFNNILYVCIEPVTTPGPWTGSVNWERASLDSIATNLNSRLAGLDLNDLSDVSFDPAQLANGDLLEWNGSAFTVVHKPLKYVHHTNSAAIAVGANGAVNVTAAMMNIDHPSGYTPIGVHDIWTSSNTCFFKNWNAGATGQTSFGVLHNDSNAAVEAICSVGIMYVRSELLDV